MEYYSVTKRIELFQATKSWRNFSKLLRKETNLKGYAQYDSNYMGFWKRKNGETVKKSVVARCCGER